MAKYFEGRQYDKEKFSKYKTYFLNELTDFLNNNYKDYGFVLSFIGFKAGNMRINHRDILRTETDDSIFPFINEESMFCEIRIYFTKLYTSSINHLQNIESNIILKMDEILSNKLEGKEYSYDIADKNANIIALELSDYLLKRKCEQIPCSFHVCYIIEKPYDIIYDYKVLKLNYAPLTASYSNDTLSAKLILFMLNN